MSSTILPGVYRITSVATSTTVCSSSAPIDTALHVSPARGPEDKELWQISLSGDNSYTLTQLGTKKAVSHARPEEEQPVWTLPSGKPEKYLLKHDITTPIHVAFNILVPHSEGLTWTVDTSNQIRLEKLDHSTAQQFLFSKQDE